jgi:soluble lytic murein transglycosylase-like protein
MRVDLLASLLRIVAAAVWLLVLLVAALGTGRALAQVPPGAEKYRRDLIREARLEWGLNAPIATFAAQIEQESGWNPDARSHVGALGLAQFMPATSTWISGAYGALAENAPRNPRWALRALATYDRYLWERVSAADDCHRAAKMLSAYNGGLGWIPRDEAAAEAAGYLRALWWRNVEAVNAGRSAAAWRENRGYPPAILFRREPRYVAAGWGRGLCE